MNNNSFTVEQLIELMPDHTIPDEFHEEVMESVHDVIEHPKYAPFELEILPRHSGGCVILLRHKRGKHRNLMYVLVMRTFMPQHLFGQDPWDDWEPADRVHEALQVLRKAKTKAERDQAVRALIAVIPEQEQLERSLRDQALKRDAALPDIDDIEDAYYLLLPEVML